MGWLSIMGLDKKLLEERLEESRQLLKSQSGGNIIVESIMFSENVLFPSEYMFNYDNGKVAPEWTLSDERTEVLKNLFEKPFTPDFALELINYKKSATASILPGTTLYHTHSLQTRSRFENGPHFSPMDRKFGFLRPLGLVEYCIDEEREKTLSLLGRLSLSCGFIQGSLPEFSVQLNEDYTYILEAEGTVTHGPVSTAAYNPMIPKGCLSESIRRITRYAMFNEHTPSP